MRQQDGGGTKSYIVQKAQYWQGRKVRCLHLLNYLSPVDDCSLYYMTCTCACMCHPVLGTEHRAFALNYIPRSF